MFGMFVTKHFEGFRFEGWTVAGMSGTGLENPAIEVLMSEGLTVTARFVEEPFVASAIGEYQGLVVPDVGMERKWENQGAVQVTVTKRGAFTGRLKMGVMPQSFSGLFNTDGASRFGIARLPETTLPRTGRVPLVLSLQWDLTPPHGMTGRVGESLRDGSVREVAAFTAQLPLGQLIAGSPYLQGGGRFDLSLLPKVQTNLALGDYPQVPGTGLLTISRGGTVRIAMNLADGMRGTAAMPIQRTMRLPLYVPIYQASTGGITGEMRLIHGDAEGDIQAPDLLWFRPVLNRAPYPFGWPEGITLDGRADAQP